MRKHPLLLTFIFTALCLLPVMLLRDFTPDNELRYLQIADEAIENGNVFAFTLQGEAYADKPPLYLWLVILSRLLLGKHSMLILSLFSLIPAFITIHVMDKWVKPGGAVDRISVAFMMMTCALFLGASVFLRMDMLMTMFIVLALYSFWQLYEDHSSGSGTVDRKRHEILLPVWIFLALFTKGPVGILMPPLAIICFLLLKKTSGNTSAGRPGESLPDFASSGSREFILTEARTTSITSCSTRRWAGLSILSITRPRSGTISLRYGTSWLPTCSFL